MKHTKKCPHNGFTLLELIIVMAIASITYLVATPNLHYFTHMKYGNLNMQQIQQAINYARSLAILYKQDIVICPSIDRIKCATYWDHGLLVNAPNGKSCFFKLHKHKYSHLKLIKSGHTTKQMLIQANGMTFHNGSFTYNSSKSSDLPQFKLYFNKALRVYIVIG